VTAAAARAIRAPDVETGFDPAADGADVVATVEPSIRAWMP
jgi:hypothetical protein